MAHVQHAAPITRNSGEAFFMCRNSVGKKSNLATGFGVSPWVAIGE